jgi:hypothetical protein
MNDTTELLHVSEMQREDDEMRELSRTTPGELTVDQLVGQIELVQDAMRRAMVDGEHFGVIPGTQKPTLLKPGAEKLCLLFRFAPTYDITRRELDGGHIEYEIVCSLTHIPTGQFAGQGVGLCTTMETRYRYRKGSHACPQCGESSIIKGREEYGGGWLCWKKKDGCGAKFPDDAFDLADLKPVENPDIADVFNTVLKIGKKRAMVDAVLTATAASDLFTQDMEDTASVPHVGTTPQPPREEVVAEDSPFDTTPDPVMANIEQIDDLAAWYWETIKKAGIKRTDAMTALKESGGDFMDAMSRLEQQQRKDT